MIKIIINLPTLRENVPRLIDKPAYRIEKFTRTPTNKNSKCLIIIKFWEEWLKMNCIIDAPYLTSSSQALDVLLSMLKVIGGIVYERKV